MHRVAQTSQDALENCDEHDCIILLNDFNVHLSRDRAIMVTSPVSFLQKEGQLRVICFTSSATFCIH